MNFFFFEIVTVFVVAIVVGSIFTFFFGTGEKGVRKWIFLNTGVFGASVGLSLYLFIMRASNFKSVILTLMLVSSFVVMVSSWFFKNSIGTEMDSPWRKFFFKKRQEESKKKPKSKKDKAPFYRIACLTAVGTLAILYSLGVVSGVFEEKTRTYDEEFHTPSIHSEYELQLEVSSLLDGAIRLDYTYGGVSYSAIIDKDDDDYKELKEFSGKTISALVKLDNYGQFIDLNRNTIERKY